jgi:hypothetical protein
VVTRLVQQSLAHAWATWSSSAHDAKKQLALTKRISKHWTNARLAWAWETWSGHRSNNKWLTKAALMVLSRWTKQSLVACWKAWVARAPAKKRLKAAAMKVIKRCTQQCLVVSLNTWSSTVREEKRMRNLLAMFQGSATAATFMRWRGRAVEEKKARHVAQKVVLRWESASKMKAFMRWEDAVQEARDQMAKSAEQASKDALTEDVTKVTVQLSKQVQQLHQLEATHTKKIMEAAHLRGKLQDVEKRADVIQQELNCLVNETQAQKSAIIKLSGEKISQLGKDLHGLKTLLEHERESRRSAEEQAQKLVSTMQLNSKFFCDSFGRGRFLTGCEFWQLARNIELEQVEKDTRAQAKYELQCVEKRVDVIQQDVACLVDETQGKISAIFKLSGEKISQLGKEVLGLKNLLQVERESRRSTEEQAQTLVSTIQLNLEFFCDSCLTKRESWQRARNLECEQLAKDAKEKLAQAKHEIACELVVKQTDIQRLKSEVQEMKMKYEHQDEDEIPMIGKVNLSRPHANKEGNKTNSECMQIKREFKYRARYAAKRFSWSCDDTF